MTISFKISKNTMDKMCEHYKYIKRDRLILQEKKNRKFPLGNFLRYISLLSVAFGRVRPGGRTLFLRLVLQSMASRHTPHKAKHFLRTENNSHLFCG